MPNIRYLTIAFIYITSHITAENPVKILRWKLKPGEVVELTRFADQDIKVNENQFSRKIMHKVILQVKNITPEGNYEVSGLFRSHLATEGKKQTLYQELEEYLANFQIKPTGQYIVPEGQYMPNIRHIPTFPERDPADVENPMTVGYRWSAMAEETLLADTLLNIPTEVQYEYLGKESVLVDNQVKNLHKIQANYQIQYQNKQKNFLKTPRRLMGLVSAIWFWDEDEGIPFYAQETYNLIFLYPNGEVHEFQIRHRSHFQKVQSFKNQEKKDLKEKLEKNLNQMKPKEKPQVEEIEEGIKVTLPDILFKYNSADIDSENKILLEQVAEILRNVKDKHLRVLGHTDNIGSYEYNLQLSRERAKNVAQFLAEKLNLPPEKISYEGFSFKYPIGDNTTEEGRKHNRRVEILILEK